MVHAYSKEISVLREICYKASKEICFYYHNGYELEEKERGQGPVTTADIKANRIIVQGLSKAFPRDGILSEESPDSLTRLEKKRIWCIDPLDGTRDFVNKTGDFAIQIGLIEEGRPVFGCLYLPDKEEFYYGGLDVGTWYEKGSEKRQIKIKKSICLPENIVLVRSRFHGESLLKIFEVLKLGKALICGSVGCKVAMILKEEANCFFYLGDHIKEWDICAPLAVLEGAGGKMTKICGSELAFNKKDPRNRGGLLASDGNCHAYLGKMISKALEKNE